MDPLPLSDAGGGRRDIRCLRPNVTRTEALAALEGRAGLVRGQLRQVADAYLPFRLYEVEVLNGGASQVSFFAADSFSGVLDLYELEAAPPDSELMTVRTRNCPVARLGASRALELLENKVRRAIFQTGFFRVRGLRIHARPLALEFHVPYWLGFFGRAERATLLAMDAVRRRFEGGKARAVFMDWLTVDS